MHCQIWHSKQLFSAKLWLRKEGQVFKDTLKSDFFLFFPLNESLLKHCSQTQTWGTCFFSLDAWKLLNGFFSKLREYRSGKDFQFYSVLKKIVLSRDPDSKCWLEILTRNKTRIPVGSLSRANLQLCTRKRAHQFIQEFWGFKRSCNSECFSFSPF